MSLLLFLLIWGSLIFSLFLLYRWLTFRAVFRDYDLFCRQYCAAVGRDNKFYNEVALVWPMKHVLVDCFYWKLDKYIVNQDSYQEMMIDLNAQAMKILKDTIAAIDGKIDALKSATQSQPPSSPAKPDEPPPVN